MACADACKYTSCTTKIITPSDDPLYPLQSGWVIFPEGPVCPQHVGREHELYQSNLATGKGNGQGNWGYGHGACKKPQPSENFEKLKSGPQVKKKKKGVRPFKMSDRQVRTIERLIPDEEYSAVNIAPMLNRSKTWVIAQLQKGMIKGFKRVGSSIDGKYVAWHVTGAEVQRFVAEAGVIKLAG